MRCSLFILTLVSVAIFGCESAPQAGGKPAAGRKAQAGAPGQPIALIHGEPVYGQDILPGLLEASGGEILAETVLDRQVSKKLQERGLTVGQAEQDQEREILLAGLDADASRAQRMMAELRRRRGLGEQRFVGLMRRNAGLRMLVRDEVQVTDMALRQAYDQQFGATYEARLIVVNGFAQAGLLSQRARDMAQRGVPADTERMFTDMAIKESTDPSAAQGGRLSPINAADATYPDGIRKALVGMEAGQVSDPVALGENFAVLYLVRKNAAQNVKFDDVKGALTQRVRHQVERLAMGRLARTLLQEADLVILDTAVRAGWDQQQRLLGQE